MNQDFEDIIEQHSEMVTRIIASYERDIEIRKDLMQDVFIAVWRALPSFRGEGELRAFIARIARNRCISHIAKAVKEPQKLELQPDLKSATPNPEQTLQEEQEYARLLAAVQSLPLQIKEVAILALEGLKYQEIALILGISVNAVTLRYKRAKKILKKVLSS